ncbi:hypothetical protein ACFV2X_42870 [Streptomyces sp. NPDC059679]|uniref:hypothetical protein n=1 Tax=Streptomyces sp. NPDC059679 TaxID=3346903 RepID=UPI0036C0A326
MEYSSKARKARLRLVGISVLAAAVVVGGGVLAVGTFGSSEKKADHTSPTKETTSPSPSRSSSHQQKFTPATGPQTPLLKPATTKNGIGVGFEHSSLGAESAAINYWQDLDILDDGITRRQLTAVTSRDSMESIDQGISQVRSTREDLGLPPSGGTPAGITISTVVKASLSRSLDDAGDVVVVWMVYDRYATVADKGADDAPLKDEVTSVIVKWQDGDWKLTEEPKYVKKKRGPSAYDPNSTFAFQDGWREVASE